MVNTKGAFLGDGLTRVDVMVSSDGSMRVNEYESLDANFSKLGQNDIEKKIRQNITDYYVEFLRRTLALLYS